MTRRNCQRRRQWDRPAHDDYGEEARQPARLGLDVGEAGQEAGSAAVREQLVTNRNGFMHDGSRGGRCEERDASRDWHYQGRREWLPRSTTWLTPPSFQTRREKLPGERTEVPAFFDRYLSIYEDGMSPRAVLAGVGVGGVLSRGFGVEYGDIRLVSAQEQPSILHSKEPGRKGGHFSDRILQRQDLLLPNIPSVRSGLAPEGARMTDRGCVGLPHCRPRHSVTGEHQPILLHR